jgi:hypothetical protein
MKTKLGLFFSLLLLTFSSQVFSELPDPSLPLDPGTGGRSIDIRALQVGDIILSATDRLPSELIQFGTDSKISHAMLYLGENEFGNRQVVEALPFKGVVIRTVEEALEDAVLAVAFRHQPNLTEEQTYKIPDFAYQQLEVRAGYDWRVGVFRQARFHLESKDFCMNTDIDYNLCKEWIGRVHLGTDRNEGDFFCSELVLAAYQEANVPLTNTPPHWGSPQDILELSWDGPLGYVGHLKVPN